ncbi:MAG TPA: hypothetical protein VE988_21175 [Gemmataceae bacterium]|nr:hypothetical protein [Gemmataceae bacterium]
MEPDLLGYALNSLDSDEHAEVEGYLRSNPEAAAKLDNLRQSLEPLAADRQVAPPAGLAGRTMAHIALAQSPPRNIKHVGMGGVPWRRILSMAAMLMVAVTAGGAGLAWIGGLRSQRPGEANAAQVTACKDNLHKAFVSLWSYASTHKNQFPAVAANGEPPPNAGAQVFNVLKDSKVLPANVQGSCPAAPDFAYAYSLGYGQAGKVIGPRVEEGKPTSLMPLMADCAPADPVHGGQSGSHGGGGQNVLYVDGHVTFCNSRFVGYNQDDIYLNRNKKVAAGVDWTDAVLTSGTPPP